MTEEQKEFLHLHVIESMDYDSISKLLGVNRADLSNWYDVDLKEERMRMASVKTLWLRKNISKPFSKFYDKYLSLERKCHYCGVTEEEIDRLIRSGRLTTKRLATRGKRLELDRKKPDNDYNDFENLTLCCYWCNNAKTDTFTEEEFKKVGLVLKEIWKERMEQ